MFNSKEGTTRIAPVFALVCAGCLAPAVPSALAAFPGDNGKIMFDAVRGDGDLELWAIGSRGGKPVNLTRSEGIDQSGSWSADGRRIVFMSNRETPRNPDPR